MSARRVELSLQLDIDDELWALFSGARGLVGASLGADVADWLVEVVSISRGSTCGAVQLLDVRDTTLLRAKAEQLGLDLQAGDHE